MPLGLLALLMVAVLGRQWASPVAAAADTRRGMPMGTATPVCLGGWSTVSSPNAGTGANGLNAVAAVSAGEAWAVGSRL